MQKNTSLKVLLSLSIVTVMLLSQVSVVAAANNQGLEWGIEVDDRFDYDFDVSYHNSTFDLDLAGEMYIVINSLGGISNDFTSLPNIPIPSLYLGTYTTHWSNGTVMDDFWKGIPFTGAPFIAYPIGNWTLMTELFELVTYATVTQDATTLNNTVVDVPSSGSVVSMVYLKSNGVAMSQSYDVAWGDTTANVEFTLTSSSTTTTSTTTTGTNTEDGDYTLILILGGGVAVVVVVVAIVLMRRK